MKRFLTVLVIFMLIVVTTIAQEVKIRLGESLESVKKEFASYTLKVDEDGDRYYFQETESGAVFYYFNSKNICYLQIYVYNSTFLPFVIRSFREDKHFIAISNLEYLYVRGNTMYHYDIIVDDRVLYIQVKLQ
jgi:hypothetical protein